MNPPDDLAPTIEWSLLGFLAEQPMHGYEIHQRLSEAVGLGMVWHVKQSHVYAMLARLEAQGYIAYTLEPQDARPPRKVYALTPAGQQAYQTWVRAPVEHGRNIRLEFMAKVYFACRQGAEALHALFGAQREMCRTWCDDLQEQRAATPAARIYEDLVYRFRLGQIQAMLQWLDESEAVLAESLNEPA